MTSSALIHWHKVDDQPSEFTEPPKCCQVAFHIAHDRKLDLIHEEAGRQAIAAIGDLITNIITAIETYEQAIPTLVVDEPTREMVVRAVRHCAELARKAACICPTEQLIGPDGLVRPIQGFNPSCAIHRAG